MKNKKKRGIIIEDMTVFEVSLAHKPRNNENFILVKDKEEFGMKKLLAYLAAKGADVPEVVKKELGDAPSKLTFDEVTSMLKDAGFDVEGMLKDLTTDALKDIFDSEKQKIVDKSAIVVDPATHHYVAKDAFDVAPKDMYKDLPEAIVIRLKDDKARIDALIRENLNAKLSDKVGDKFAADLIKLADLLPEADLLSVADIIAAKDKIIKDLSVAKGTEDLTDNLSGEKRDELVKDIMEKQGVDKVTALGILASQGFYAKED